MTKSNINELATALAAVQAELDPAVKDSTNPFLGNKYADLSACWDALKVTLPKHDLAVIQGGVQIEGKDYLETMLCHKSGQWVSGLTPIVYAATQETKLDSEGQTKKKGLNPMQALGSAWSYARRYGLAAICGLTAEDEDASGAGTPPAGA